MKLLNSKYLKWMGLSLLIGAFFLGRCIIDKEVKTITKTIPILSGKSSVIFNPAPLAKVKDSIRYKDSIIYSQGKFNKELVNKFINTSGNIDQIKQYISAVEENKYEIPFEDENIKISNHIVTEGKLVSFSQEYTTKEKNITFNVPVTKSKVNFLLGGGVSNTTTLDKFNIQASSGLQRKNGDVIYMTYGILDKSITVGYLIKF